MCIVKVRKMGLQNTKFCAILLVLVMFVGIFGLSPAISSLMNYVVVKSIGEISTPNLTAKSGSATDIQLTVDAVASSGGVGNVFIPEGTFNFIEVDEPWMTVEIPAGVNIFGAPTERDANGQVVEWKTILVIPWDVPGSWEYGGKSWFKIVGNSDPNKHFQFSDIKLVGYRSIDSSSTFVQKAIAIENVVDFRVDHCYFENVCLGSVTAINSNGVIDHCFLVNTYGVVKPSIADCTVFYGVDVARGYGDLWEDDISKVLGQYTPYTVFIENCYFSKWRHCVAANSGAHYVFRHNIIEGDYAYGSLDAHGWGSMSGGVITQVGTRAMEVYNNSFLTPNPVYTPDAIYFRGGGGIVFSNTFEGYTRINFLLREAQTEVSKCWPHDIWIWDNVIPSSSNLVVVYNDPVKGAPQENVDYFLHAPHSITYMPYPYPHPLTLETTS